MSSDTAGGNRTTMKMTPTVLILSAILACATAVDLPAEIRAAQRGASPATGPAAGISLFADPAKTSDAICQNATRSCRDCNAVNLCALLGGSYIYSTYVTCPPSTPYCNNGTCTTNPLSDNCLLPSISPAFKCFPGQDGYFPAPDNCRTYFICHNGDAYKYTCPAGHIYNHPLAMCVRQTTASECFTFNCAGNVGKFLPYPADESYYVYCRYNYNTLSGMWMSRCPPNYRIKSADEASCQVYCAKPGRILDEENPQRYWECRYVGSQGTLEPVLQTCPKEMSFNDTVKRCV